MTERRTGGAPRRTVSAHSRKKLCLGSLRGGPLFLALFLGAAAGALLAPLPGMAAGMAAALIPVVILAAVAAFVTVQLLPAGHPAPAPSESRAGTE